MYIKTEAKAGKMGQNLSQLLQKGLEERVYFLLLKNMKSRHAKEARPNGNQTNS